MFTVQILGSSSATPAFNRNTSAQIVNFNDRFYLVDCGEGTQTQMQRYHLRYARLDAVFISHLHSDHFLGAPGLFSSLSIFEREAPLPVFAPAGLKDIIHTIFSYSDTYLKYPLTFFPLEDFAPGEVIFQTDRLEVSSFPLSHKIFCRGFLFKEKNKKRKINSFLAKDLGIPSEYFHLIKQGNDITLPDGRTFLANDLLFQREPPLAYAYCSDTRFEESIAEAIQHVDLLYHEATFTEAFRKRAKETYHSTAGDAARMAVLAQAKKLAIGHFSARFKDLNPLLEEAAALFPNTELAIEGRIFDLRAHG